MSIQVIVLKGKGRNNADYVTMHDLVDDETAKAFIDANTKDGKYWSHAEVVVPSHEIDTHYEQFFD